LLRSALIKKEHRNNAPAAAAPPAAALTVETWPIERPIPYARNPRKNLGAVDKVAASLKEFGWQQPIVVDLEDVVVVGDTRLRAAHKLRMAHVPVVVARHLTAAQCKAYRLADNRTNEEAEWDEALLALELEDLRLADYALALTAFDARELGMLAAMSEAAVAGLTDPDDAPAVAAVPVSVPGDVWLLGRHRLVCGDATTLAAVQALMMGDELADLVLTDPPYNVGYVGKTKDALTIQGDQQGGAPFYQFLFESFTNMRLVAASGAGIYVFHADTEGMNFRKALVDAGWKLSQCCVWVKNSMVMGRQDYHWQHEEHSPALVGWLPDAAHRWYADRRQTTVWQFDRPTRSLTHPTMKPVALLEYILENSSRPGDRVLDIFGGSGSTLIACEKAGRLARLMELDPSYADVIVRRWQNFTGRQAVDAAGRFFTQRDVAPRS
jgi:DNA modification methylase